MITFLRKKLHSGFYKIILWMTLLSMILIAGIPSCLKSRKNEGDTIAWINGQPISSKELQRATSASQEKIAMTYYQYEQMGIPVDKNMFNIDPQQLAFTGLVENALLDTVAHKMHLSLNEDYVAYKLSDPYYVMGSLAQFMPYHSAAQVLRGGAIDRALRSKGVTIADFEDFVERDLAVSMVKELVANAVYIPAFALKDSYMLEYVAKKFSVATIPFDTILKQEKKVALSQEEVAKFFEEQKNNYIVPEHRDAVVWVFSPESYGIKITDEAVRSFYDTNKSAFIETPRIDNKAAVYKSYDKVKEEIKADLMLQEFKYEFSEAMDRIIQQVKSEATAIESFAAAKHAKQTTHTQVGMDNSLLATKLFAIKGKDFDYYRDGDKGYLVQLKAVHKSYTPALADIAKEVEQDLYALKARSTWMSAMAKADKLAKTMSLAEVAQQFDGQVKQIDWLKLEDKERMSSLAKEGLPVDKMLQIEKLGSIVPFYGEKQGYLVRLDEVKAFDEQDFLAKKSKVWQSVYAREDQAALAGFIASLNRNATLEINEKALETPATE